MESAANGGGITGAKNVNGDDDMGGTVGEGTDWGGSMYTSPAPPPTPDDDDDGHRLNKRRTQRRRSRPQFRSERKARRAPR
jgi:hypothetical protein